MDSTCYLNQFFGCSSYGIEGMVLGMWYFLMIKTKSQCPWGTCSLQIYASGERHLVMENILYIVQIGLNFESEAGHY